jgi:N-acetylmuramoyl-L-alanine amidase
METRKTTDTIVIHCTQTPKDMNIGVEQITEWHTKRGFDTIGYHFVICRDGMIQAGRDIHAVGAHAVQVNGTSIGIALVGGGTKDMGWEDNFNPEQFESLKTLILKLKNDYPEIDRIIGHYQVENKKACPSFEVPRWLDRNGLV